VEREEGDVAYHATESYNKIWSTRIATHPAIAWAAERVLLFARVIDFDTHILPREAFRFVDARFKDLVPAYSFNEQGICTSMTFRGAPAPMGGATPQPGPGTGSRYLGMYDETSRIEDMDRLGIDVQVLIPQFQAFWSYLLDSDLAAAMARSYNRSIATIVSRAPDRFVGGALIPLQCVESAIAELEWAHENQLPIVVLDKVMPVREHCFSMPLASQRELWPFFRRVAELGMPMLLHTVPHGHRTTNNMMYQMDGLDVFAPPEGHISLMSLVTSGLLDECPELRVIFTEAGTSFIEPMLRRFDAAFLDPPVDYDAEDAASVFNIRRLTSGKRLVPFDAYRPKNQARPSDYFRKNFYFTIETEEPGFAEAVAFLGASQFLFATDYPHDDPGGWMKMQDVALLNGNTSISEEHKVLIFSANAVRLFERAGYKVASAGARPQGA
jgi:predicted TIM-barrel fold metal-dependent hydrolase